MGGGADGGDLLDPTLALLQACRGQAGAGTSAGSEMGCSIQCGALPADGDQHADGCCGLQFMPQGQSLTSDPESGLFAAGSLMPADGFGIHPKQSRSSIGNFDTTA